MTGESSQSSPLSRVFRSTHEGATGRGRSDGPFPSERTCPCGRDFAWIAGLCRACYRAAARSRQRFAGLREEVLERDGHACRACGAAERLHVHHRKPGIHERELLITVCAGCHARLHRLGTVRIWIPELLVVLWEEQHPGIAVQLQFPEAA